MAAEGCAFFGGGGIGADEVPCDSRCFLMKSAGGGGFIGGGGR